MTGPGFLFVALLLRLSPGSEAAPQPAEAPSSVIYLRAGRLFDGSGDNYLTDQTIVIDGERIKAVGPASSLPIPGEQR